MHRHWLERALAALVLVWFVVVTTEPAVLHSCPVHSSLALAGAAAEQHGAEQHGAGHGHANPAPDRDHADCTCVGDCSAGASSVGLASGEQRLVAAMSPNSRAADIQADLPRITAPAFLLPYANGPPGIRVLA